VALSIAGIPPRWALVIGFFAGMANVVPYAGIGTALAGGMLYALLGYETHPLLPFVDAENLPWAVLAAVLATDSIKNAVYDPLVFGGALELHPVAVILGVAAGATIFGFLGALFAVPALAFGRALVGSVFRQLRAYDAI
jgi:predicted PurR-regulated permease PerM